MGCGQCAFGTPKYSFATFTFERRQPGLIKAGAAAERAHEVPAGKHQAHPPAKTSDCCKNERRFSARASVEPLESELVKKG